MTVAEGDERDSDAAVNATSSGGSLPVCRPGRWRAHLPRLEAVILLFGLACNLAGKYYVLRDWHPDNPIGAMFRMSLGDITFFGSIALLIALAHAYGPGKLTSRLAILGVVVVAGWSAANMAWLTATGVQIHVGVLANLFRHPMEFGPIVTNRLVNKPKFSIPLLSLTTLFAIFVLWRLARPKQVRRDRLRYGLQSLLAAGIVAGSWGISVWIGSAAPADPRQAALSYNSHWFALTTLLGINGIAIPDEAIGPRRVARAGERRIVPPPADSPRPHVVMIVMESTAWWATSFGGQRADQTPTLTELARQGVLFENTRTVVTHSTQSQFSMLAGVSPSLEGGFVEAVLVDPPYETLATILRSSGYRTYFSQMVKATFECNPGLVANLGFESFWAREDLQDPSAHLGYFAGDDFKMIGPAFAWFDRQTDPCLMLFMTSVAHDPYEVPSWYGPAIKARKRAYFQTVRFTDDFVKAVVNELKKRGQFSNTVLCVVADHGEGFGRHDILQHNANPYDEAIRVPWLVTWPEKLQGPRVVTGLCSLLDVAPTILGLLGFDISDAGFEGRNALLAIPAERRIRFSGWDPVDPAGFVQGHGKVVYWPSLGTAYRYDLSNDPQEDAPVMLSERETEHIRQQLAAWRNRSRITFDPKRYREQFLFNRWQTSSLGNTSWCYYVPHATKDGP